MIRGRGMGLAGPAAARPSLAWLGVAGLALVLGFCFLGPQIWRASPSLPHMGHVLAPPTARFPMGTDALGRDVLARLMWGGQVSLMVGIGAGLASMVVGASAGLVAGYAGGLVDRVMMRLVDLVSAVPVIFYLLFMDAVIRPSVPALVLIIAGTSWFGVARLVRAEVLAVKERDFVAAARSLGGGAVRIIVRHLLPNVMGTVLVATLFQVCNAILFVATLSFLGLGLPAPAPDWGGMLSSSMDYMFQNAWWLVYPPGVLLVWALLSVHFVAEGLHAAFNVRLRGMH